MRLLVVWEPILPTDWRPPSRSTLERIADLRAQQFWDPHHMVAEALNEIAKKKPPQPQPECCLGRGFYWDEAILYPPSVRWQDAGTSAFWNGPVVRIVPGLEMAWVGQP